MSLEELANREIEKLNKRIEELELKYQAGRNVALRFAEHILFYEALRVTVIDQEISKEVERLKK